MAHHVGCIMYTPAHITQISAILKKCMKAYALEEIEFELRLGRSFTHGSRTNFNAHISQSTFEHIQRKLEKSSAWGNVETSHTTDYFIKASSVRVTYDHDQKHYTSVSKTKLEHVDIACETSAVDIRCAFARECVVGQSHTMPEQGWLFSREKHRTRYHYRHFCFDLTRVQRHSSHHEDSDESEVYEIEIELAKPVVLESLPVEYVVEHALMLCKDIVSMT